MKILLKQVRIIDTKSPFHGQVQDVLIEDGKIAQITDAIEAATDTEVLDANGQSITHGFVDIFAHFNDPGIEHKEVLETGVQAALFGGYSHVFILPNTKPAIQNKTTVEYVVQKSKSLPVHVMPIGAASQNIGGEVIGEMYDMYNSGAVAFSDGLKPVQSAGLFLKMLQYVKAFNGVLIQQPFDDSIAAHGMMNEGVISTKIGLPGMPSIAEEIIIQRDIELLRYTNSRLHITGVSTAKSLALISTAKAEGLDITCSVTPYHLTFCDEDLEDYDTNLKVNPPLRTKSDRDALRKALVAGEIDLIATHHFPQSFDEKVCEFETAYNGMIGLQTAFATVNTAVPELSEERLSKIFSVHAREIFGLNQYVIEPGQEADLTIFSKEGTSTLTKSNNKSKSANSPFLDVAQQGAVAAVITKGKLHKIGN